MKTYYDLTNKEKREYLKEFKKTPVGKDMNIRRIIADIITTTILVLFFVIDWTYETNIFNIIFVCSCIIEILYNTYFNLNFTAWLKNKHDIKRW